MPYNLGCPKCDHYFCGSCLTKSWTIPNVFWYDGGYPHSEVVLACCGCGATNQAAFWKEEKLAPKKKVNADSAGQMDLFK